MGLFDKMKQAAAATGGNQTVTFTFQALPESLAQMQALPEASLDTPFKAAALTVCALCAYGADKTIGQEMLNWLRGPRPLNGQDISFLNDRFRDGKSYIPFSYFVGASPENGYTPASPSPCWWAATTPPMWRRATASCSSPAAVPIAPGPSSCGARATASGSCGSST